MCHREQSFMNSTPSCFIAYMQNKSSPALILNGGIWNKWIQKHLLDLGFLFESFFFVYSEMKLKKKKDWISFTELRN